MAGLFDFKSAEEILQERKAATKANQQQLLNTIVSAAPQESRQASMLGAQLGIALGRAMGAKSEQEQLQKFRDMGETTQAMEQAGVGTEGSSYGAGVLEQAQAEEQRRMGLLPEEVQQSERVRIGMERTPEDLDLVGRYRYMAEVLQDAGFSARAGQAALLADKEAQRQLERGELTKYQEIMSGIAEQNAETARLKAQAEAALFNLGAGGGAPAGGGTNPSPNELPEGTKLLVNGVPNVIVNGRPTPVYQVEAAQNLSNRGIGTEPSAGEGFLETLATPWRALNNWSQGVENESSLQFVQNALKRNSFRPEDERAAMRVLEMPRELTGLTEAQYKILEEVVTGGLKLGGQ